MSSLRNYSEGRTIEITKCNAGGKIFSNLTPKSRHTVIAVPSQHKVDNRGLWVMGVGEPVKVLNREFVYV